MQSIDDQEMQALLVQLARPGVRLSKGASGVTLADASARATVAVPDALFAAASAAGYLCAGNFGASLVLSPIGRARARAVLMGLGPQGKDGPVGKSKPVRRKPQTKRRGRNAVLDPDARNLPKPAREPHRMPVVEQLHRRKDAQGHPLLSAIQFSAAQRFATDFAMAQMQPRVTSRWSVDGIVEPKRRSVPGAGVELATTTSAAQERVRSALAVLGGRLADLVLDVCGFDLGLEAIEARHNWPSRSGRVALQLALDSLARHYGMEHTARADRAATRHVGDGDFRPSAAKWTKP